MNKEKLENENIMKIYKTNQESINKGILKELSHWHFWKTSKNTLLNYPSTIKVIIDNRIKGYCLKEY